MQGPPILGLRTDHDQVGAKPEPVRPGGLGLGRRGGDGHPVGQGVLGARRDLGGDPEVDQGHAQGHGDHHPQHPIDVGAGGPDHHHLAGPRHLGEGEQRADQHAERGDLLELAGQAQQRIVSDAAQALAALEDLGGDVQQLQDLNEADQHHHRHNGAGQEHTEDVAVESHEVAPAGSWANSSRAQCTRALIDATARVMGVSPGRFRLDMNNHTQIDMNTRAMPPMAGRGST